MTARTAELDVTAEVTAAAALVHSLIQIMDRENRRGAAFEAIDTLWFPAAVFAPDSATPLLTNLAWRSRFAQPPAPLPEWVTHVASTDRAESIELLDGPTRYSAHLRTVRGCLGASTGVIVVCADRTAHAKLLAEARAARADADAAHRLKDEFLTTVSHELLGPVATIQLWEKVLREQTDGTERTQALDAIRESARAQARLVGDLLDISRGISGKLVVDLVPLSLGDVMAATLAAALPAARACQVTLSSVDTDPGTVLGNSARLRQVLDTVLGYAIESSEPGGAVTIRTHAHEREIVIQIVDTGRGIPPHLTDRIFEPFHPAEDALVPRQDRLNLGLAVARQLVELHGGSLRASSAGVGRGSTFSIHLPASNHPVRMPSPEAAPSLLERRVLVIDDDSRVRDALTLLLRRAGVIVHTAESAAEGQARLAAARPEVIICDIAMPNEDAYAFIRGLRASGCRIPAIALTAHSMEADVTRALEAGFTLHLAKPVHFERLVTSIRLLIAPSRDAVTFT